MKIYILQYKGISRISRTIQVITWSPYSHSTLANSDTGEVIEAWEKSGIDLAHDPWENHTPGTEIDIYELECSELEAARIWSIGLKLVGGKYDFLSLLGFLPILRHFWRDDPDAFFCSHFVAHCCRKAGAPIFSEQTLLYKISPGVIPWSPKLRKVATVRKESEWNYFIKKDANNE